MLSTSQIWVKGEGKALTSIAGAGLIMSIPVVTMAEHSW